MIIGWAALLLLNSTGEIKPALAESTCEPPEENEYLLLIVSPTSAEQRRVRRTLPEDIESEVCQYVDDIVTRVGGFEDRLIAEDWAAYLEDTVALQAYVVKPGAAVELIEQEPNSKQQPPTPAVGRQLSRSAFNPERLGPGYAVLVDYFNQPELAEQVRQALGTDIGLVSYGQRPYLLIEYTSDAETAASTLKSLSRQGFWPMVVDSHRVSVIRPQLD